jgi:hypothetical protein
MYLGLVALVAGSSGYRTFVGPPRRTCSRSGGLSRTVRQSLSKSWKKTGNVSRRPTATNRAVIVYTTLCDGSFPR